MRQPRRPEPGPAVRKASRCPMSSKQASGRRRREPTLASSRDPPGRPDQRRQAPPAPDSPEGCADEGTRIDRNRNIASTNGSNGRRQTGEERRLSAAPARANELSGRSHGRGASRGATAADEQRLAGPRGSHGRRTLRACRTGSRSWPNRRPKRNAPAAARRPPPSSEAPRRSTAAGTRRRRGGRCSDGRQAAVDQPPGAGAAGSAQHALAEPVRTSGRSRRPAPGWRERTTMRAPSTPGGSPDPLPQTARTSPRRSSSPSGEAQSRRSTTRAPRRRSGTAPIEQTTGDTDMTEGQIVRRSADGAESAAQDGLADAVEQD